MIQKKANLGGKYTAKMHDEKPTNSRDNRKNQRKSPTLRERGGWDGIYKCQLVNVLKILIIYDRTFVSAVRFVLPLKVIFGKFMNGNRRIAAFYISFFIK